MKRHPALFAVIVLMAFPATFYSQRDSAQSKKTDRERYHFLGPVELVRDEWVTFSDKPDEHGEYAELERVYMGIRVFDIDGKMVFSHPPLYGPCIRSTQKVPAYDDKGNMIEEITYDDLSGSFLSKAIFKYDENGNQTESAYYGPDGLSFIRRYDAKGREIEEAKYNGEDFLEYREVKTYDENSNVIEKRTYDRDGLLTKRHLTTFEYDEKGNRIKGVIWKCNTEDEGQPCRPDQAFYTVITYHSETNGKEP